MKMNEEEIEKLGLIISHFRNVSRSSRKEIQPMLEEVLDEKSAKALAFYIVAPTKEDTEKTISRVYKEGIFSPKIAACSIIHLDHLGDPDLFEGVAKIIMGAVREGLLLELLKSLYSMSFISVLSLNTRASIISWVFSTKDNLTEDVLDICRSPFFFPSDAKTMVMHLIRLKMYNEAVEFSIENESESLRMDLAVGLPIEYMVHLMDSPSNVLEVIDRRFQSEE